MTESPSPTLADGSPSIDAPPEQEPGELLEAGTLLAERYRIVGFLARGAMGEVYDALDILLGERVALKRIHPALAMQPRVVERFRRESRLARRVTHGNVCRVFDLGSHEVPGRPPIVFLTMELLAGVSLADQLRRRGKPLSVAEAGPIVLQLIAGLGAAHRAGVIHRDFKPHNVVLVGDRAVITDFGLACAELSTSSEGQLSDAGAFLGTPAYMAPEQITGGETTAATDIYALGAVMYEMVTGRLPFAGSTPLALASARLAGRPPAPRRLVRGLDRAWDGAILRCLERRPAARFASAEAVTRALRRPALGRSRAWIVAAVGATLLAGGWVVARGRDRTNHGRRTVAVLDLRDLSARADRAWLSTALGEMLRSEVSGGRIRSVPGDAVVRMQREGGDDPRRARDLLHAELVVLGSYSVVGDQIRVDVQLQDSDSAEILAAVGASSTEAELPHLVARVGERLRGALGERESAPATAAVPSRPEARRLYAEGLARLRAFEPLAATEILGRAIAAEPEYPLAYSALAQAWSDLGYRDRARVEAKRALDLASALPREERLLVEARYRDAAEEPAEAIAAYRELFDLDPANLEYGVRLARAQADIHRYADARMTIARLRSLPGVADDPLVDLVEGLAADGWPEELEHLGRAAARAEARGARLLLAEILGTQIHGWMIEGEAERAQRAGQQALTLYRALGHRAGEALTLCTLAPIRAANGDYPGALADLDGATDLALEAGNKRLAATIVSHAGEGYLRWSDLASARRRLEHLRRLLDEVPDEELELRLKGLEGWLRFEEGDVEGARALFAAALEGEGRIGGFGPRIRLNLAELELAAGAFDAARADLDRAEEGWRLDGAIIHLMAAGVLRAEIALEEGRPADAEQALRDHLTMDPERVDRVLNRLRLARLAQALALQGKAGEARATARQALDLWPMLPLRHRVAVAAAALAVLDEGAAGRARVAEVRDEARRVGIVRLALEAELALAADSGARPRLAAVEAEARQLGLGRLVRRATALSR